MQSILVGLLFMLIPLLIELHHYKIEARSGALGSSVPASTANISVGAARLHFDNPDGIFMREGEKPILEVKLQPYKRLWFLPSQQRLLISATIRDARGKVVAKLEDNQWSTDVPTYDRNYRDDAFEVRDGDGNVVLQVVNFGYTIHMAGVFRCKNGLVNVIAPGYDAQAGNDGAMEIKPPWTVPNTKIKPICDYPSDLHLGECPGIDALHKLLAPPNAPAINAGGELVCNDKNIGVEKP